MHKCRGDSISRLKNTVGVSPGLADRDNFLLMGCRVHMVQLQGNLNHSWDIPARTE